MKNFLTTPRLLIVGGVAFAALASSGATVFVMQHTNKAQAASTSQSNSGSSQLAVRPAANGINQPPASTYDKAQLFSLGQTVTYASETAVVNSAKAATVISNSYNTPTIADDGSKFIVVSITLTNTTSSPFAYSPFGLIDQKGRLFESYPDVYTAVDNYLANTSLQPGVPHTGNEVYQVPADDTEFRIGGYVGNSSTIRLVKFTPTN